MLDKLATGHSHTLNFALDLVVVILAWEATSLGGSVVACVAQVLLVSFGWCFVSACFRLYAPIAPRRWLDGVALLVIAIAWTTAGAAVLIAIGHWLGSDIVLDLSRFSLVFGIGAIATNLICRPLAKANLPTHSSLIVGTGPLGIATFTRLTTPGAMRCHVVGFVRWPDDAAADLPGALLGESKDILDILSINAVSEVFLAGRVFEQAAAMQDVISACENVGMPFAVPLHSLRMERAVLLSISAASDGYLHYLGHRPQPLQSAVTRLFSIVLSFSLLVVLSPLLVVVAALIKLTSRGPVLFKQMRVGLHGSRFNLLKFRSMVSNAEELKAKLLAQNEQSGPVFKIKHDPRITRIGRFIRKYSIDELPQLINILRGDMTFVGPRPALPEEVAQYKAWQRRRLSVRPGLTCDWQVSGRNSIGFEEWMRLDLNYIDNWSLRNDIALIFRTIPLVLSGRGAS
jgi:exopolysaccharide biosynthesis polyprenyl glycosylphosphotransferase